MLAGLAVIEVSQTLRWQLTIVPRQAAVSYVLVMMRCWQDLLSSRPRLVSCSDLRPWFWCCLPIAARQAANADMFAE